MTRTEIENGLIEFVSERFPTLGSEITFDTRLADGDAVDSLGILEIVAHIDERYGVEISDEDFSMEHFESIRSVSELVASKKGS